MRVAWVVALGLVLSFTSGRGEAEEEPVESKVKVEVKPEAAPKPAKPRKSELTIDVADTSKGHASTAGPPAGADPLKWNRCDRACKRAIPERCEARPPSYDALFRACHAECAAEKPGTPVRLSRYICVGADLSPDGTASLDELIPPAPHHPGPLTPVKSTKSKHKRNAWDTN